MESLLESIAGSKDLLQLRKGATIFSQGEEADAIYFIQTGKVQLTVVSAQGKEAVLATRGHGEFLGEECLAGASRRTSTALSLGPATVFGILKHDMLQALHGQPMLSEKFTTSLLARNVSLEKDLCDQLFNHTERRLARLLLTLCRFDSQDKLQDVKVPKFTNKMLAESVGTTPSRIGFFMNKFRQSGLVDYQKGNKNLIVMTEALTDSILRDELKPKPRIKPAFRNKQNKVAAASWNLLLYVAGATRKSAAAFRNLEQICEKHLAGRYNIEVIDLMKNPEIARDHQIVAIPTVVRRQPSPILRIIGDLSNTERVLAGLDLRPAS